MAELLWLSCLGPATHFLRNTGQAALGPLTCWKESRFPKDGLAMLSYSHLQTGAPQCQGRVGWAGMCLRSPGRACSLRATSRQTELCQLLWVEFNLFFKGFGFVDFWFSVFGDFAFGM